MSDKTGITDDTEYRKYSTRVKICTYCSLVFFLIIGIIIMSMVWVNEELAVNYFNQYKGFIKNNFLISVMILIIIFIIGQVFFLPTALFTLICGIMFGTYMDGNIIAYFSAFLFWLFCCGITGLIPFNISKIIFKEKIQKYIIQHNTKLKNFEMVLKKYGTKSLFLIRLSPLLPVTLYNYIIGGFEVTNKMYFLSSFGSFPGELFYIYLGYSAVNFENFLNKKNENRMVEIGLTIFGAVVIIILTIIFIRISRTEFNKLMDNEAEFVSTRAELGAI